MSYKVIQLPAVKADLLQSVDYYKTISPVLAGQFLSRLREAKNYISLSPLSFQVKYKNVRTLLMKQFPYHVHYIVDESHELIIILAIIHSYKNPMDYSNRK